MHPPSLVAARACRLSHTAYSQRDSACADVSLRPSKVCANTQMGGLPAGGLFFVKGLRVHACSVLRAPKKEVATGGNAK